MIENKLLIWERETNPLIRGIAVISRRVAVFKELARRFYFTVLLSLHSCPACGGDLKMAGASKCSCRCGLTLDPTAEFQRSACCDARLVQRSCHYACAKCKAIVPSRFLFDERVFDHDYFCEKMRESRDKKKKKREEIKKLLAASRSGALWLTDTPDLESVPGLAEDLEAFLGAAPGNAVADFIGEDEFLMDEYRRAIWERLDGCSTMFSAIPAISMKRRKDLTRRFITLIFMQHEREIDLTQYGNEILVEKHETYA